MWIPGSEGSDQPGFKIRENFCSFIFPELGKAERGGREGGVFPELEEGGGPTALLFIQPLFFYELY